VAHLPGVLKGPPVCEDLGGSGERDRERRERERGFARVYIICM